MFEIGVAKAGLLRIPASPSLRYDFLEVAPRTIQHYGVEVNGLRYNGSALDPYRNARSPYGGSWAGKWPIRVNPDDVRYVWFQDPDRPRTPDCGRLWSVCPARRHRESVKGGWRPESVRIGVRLSRPIASRYRLSAASPSASSARQRASIPRPQSLSAGCAVS
jgi:Mu transposase, C-terminal